MKYKIIWIESHDPIYYGKTWEEGKEILLRSLPNAEVTSISPDDYILDIECKEYFKAKTIIQAKLIARDYFVKGETGVFAVFDSKGKMVFTEQDLEDVKDLEYCEICDRIFEIEEHHIHREEI